MIGERFTSWIVIGLLPTPKGGHRKVLCRCVCGSEKPVFVGSLRSGASQSCGCLYRAKNAEITRIKKTTHGNCQGRKPTPEYHCWSHMKRRCYCKQDKSFHRYGGRGIEVCDRWKDDFSAFLNDMGLRPSSKHSIDRIDPNGNYEPSNCRWATWNEQARTRRNSVTIEAFGVSVNLHDLCEQVDGNAKVIAQRIRRGWSHERALTEPRNTNNGSGRRIPIADQQKLSKQLEMIRREQLA